jgi:hypothetical protein
VPNVKKIRGLNLPEPLGPPRPVAGDLYIFSAISYKKSFSQGLLPFEPNIVFFNNCKIKVVHPSIIQQDF